MRQSFVMWQFIILTHCFDDRSLQSFPIVVVLAKTGINRYISSVPYLCCRAVICYVRFRLCSKQKDDIDTGFVLGRKRAYILCCWTINVYFAFVGVKLVVLAVRESRNCYDNLLCHLHCQLYGTELSQTANETVRIICCSK